MDTENGKADFVDALKINRNSSYILILRPNTTVAEESDEPEIQPFVEVTRLNNPKSFDKILNTAIKSLSKDTTDQSR